MYPGIVLLLLCLLAVTSIIHFLSLHFCNAQLSGGERLWLSTWKLFSFQLSYIWDCFLCHKKGDSNGPVQWNVNIEITKLLQASCTFAALNCRLILPYWERNAWLVSLPGDRHSQSFSIPKKDAVCLLDIFDSAGFKTKFQTFQRMHDAHVVAFVTAYRSESDSYYMRSLIRTGTVEAVPPHQKKASRVQISSHHYCLWSACRWSFPLLLTYHALFCTVLGSGHPAPSCTSTIQSAECDHSVKNSH